jgi:hypothetical protein
MMNPYSEYAERMEVEQMIMSNNEMGRAAPSYVLEVWWTS